MYSIFYVFMCGNVGAEVEEQCGILKICSSGKI